MFSSLLPLGVTASGDMLFCRGCNEVGVKSVTTNPVFSSGASFSRYGAVPAVVESILGKDDRKFLAVVPTGAFHIGKDRNCFLSTLLAFIR